MIDEVQAWVKHFLNVFLQILVSHLLSPYSPTDVREARLVEVLLIWVKNCNIVWLKLAFSNHVGRERSACAASSNDGETSVSGKLSAQGRG